MKKLGSLLMGILLLTPVLASAQTTNDSTIINALESLVQVLMQEVSLLQQQLAIAQHTTVASPQTSVTHSPVTVSQPSIPSTPSSPVFGSTDSNSSPSVSDPCAESMNIATASDDKGTNFTVKVSAPCVDITTVPFTMRGPNPTYNETAIGPWEEDMVRTGVNSSAKDIHNATLQHFYLTLSTTTEAVTFTFGDIMQTIQSVSQQ